MPLVQKSRRPASQETICEGESLELRVTEQPGWRYQWSNGVTNASQVVTPTHWIRYANASMNYRVTVTDQNGCSRTDFVRVNVVSTPWARIKPLHPHCGQSDGGVSFTFADHPHQKLMYFSVTGQNGTYYKTKDENGAFRIMNLSAGLYEVWVKWKDDACPVKLKDVELIDLPGPAIDAGPDLTVCQNSSVKLSVNRKTGWTYLWSNGVETARQSVVPGSSNYRNKTNTYSVVVTDQFGCRSKDWVKVTVQSLPQPKFKVLHPNCGRRDGAITFTFRNHPDFTKIEFSITGRDGKFKRVLDEVGTLTFGNLSVGTYSAWARWRGGACPVNIGKIELIDNPGPHVDLGRDQFICEGRPVKLGVQGTDGWTYNWSNNVAGPAQVVKPTLQGYNNQIFSYSVVVRDEINCTATDDINITLISNPKAEMSFTMPTCGQSDGAVTFLFDDHPDHGRMEFGVNGTGRGILLGKRCERLLDNWQSACWNLPDVGLVGKMELARSI